MQIESHRSGFQRSRYRFELASIPHRHAPTHGAPSLKFTSTAQILCGRWLRAVGRGSEVKVIQKWLGVGCLRAIQRCLRHRIWQVGRGRWVSQRRTPSPDGQRPAGRGNHPSSRRRRPANVGPIDRLRTLSRWRSAFTSPFRGKARPCLHSSLCAYQQPPALASGEVAPRMGGSLRQRGGD